MKAWKGLWAAVVIGSVLAGCGDDADSGNKYEVSDETCNAQYWKTLPEGKSRDALVEQCMTRGAYQSSEPKVW